jgi:DNA polymerase III epsilon subunit-like protein
MPQFYDYMIDVETTGVHPDENAIIQISAVRFDIRNLTIDTTSMFDRCLRIPKKRFWDEDTRGWWLGKNRDVYQTLVPRMEDPKTVLEAFRDWAVQNSDTEEPRRFWAKPTSFDWPFMQSYFDQFGVQLPFHFRFTMDVNTYIRGLANDPNANLNYREMQGPAHNALFDCLHQIGNLFAAVEHHRAPVVS